MTEGAARILLRSDVQQWKDATTLNGLARVIVDHSMRKAHAAGVSITELCEITGMARNTVRAVVRSVPECESVSDGDAATR